MHFAKQTYLITQEFPTRESFNLVSRIQRTAVSIPSNIEVGCGQNTNRQICYFINISIGSTCEIETQLLLSYSLNYLDDKPFTESQNEIIEIRKMLVGFKNRLKIP